MWKPDLKEWLYRTGTLSLYHRIRNRNTLTVLAFHRVLDTSDPRWAACDPDYTISSSLFRECLELAARHYSVVSLAEVLRAQERAATLPPRALLITFDDGWQDSFQYALPVLRDMEMPAVLFAVGDAIGRRAAFFQEQLVAAWRRGALGPGELKELAGLAGMAVDTGKAVTPIASLRRVIAALESLPAERRLEILERFRSVLDDGHRHFLSAEELRDLVRGGVSVGAHGMTHTPLTRVASAADELREVRHRLSSLLQAPPDSVEALSFPHGKYDAGVLAAVAQTGYRLAFTSDPALNRAVPGPPPVLARVGFEESYVTDGNRRLRPGQLAAYLFRRPIVRLA